MATYNNKHWLLSHVRNSFISTDDTGLCETIMLCEDIPSQYAVATKAAGVLIATTPNPTAAPACGVSQLATPSTPIASSSGQSVCSTSSAIRAAVAAARLARADYVCYPGLDQSDDEDNYPDAHSYEIQMDQGGFIMRSNTAQKLEKMKMASKRAAKIKNVKCQDPAGGAIAGTGAGPPGSTSEASAAEIAALFVRKPVLVAGERPRPTSQLANIAPRGSLLATQLEAHPNLPHNIYQQYAKFDGSGQSFQLTRTIQIFLQMLPPAQRNYPMSVCCIDAARIQDFIGLICYKASIEHPEIRLQPVRNYALHITEDTGEVDQDFPPLDLQEPLAKFQFYYLSLVERRVPLIGGEIGPAAAARTMSSLSSASDAKAEQERQAAEKEAAEQQQRDALSRMLGHTSKMEAPIYRSYQLQIARKGWFKTDIQLGISAEKLEIDPRQQQNSRFWSHQKAISHSMDAIVWCEITAEPSPQRALVKIVYCTRVAGEVGAGGSIHSRMEMSEMGLAAGSPSSRLTSTVGGGGSVQSPSVLHSFSSAAATAASASAHSGQLPSTYRSYKFITDARTAQEIVDKVRNILEVRSSPARREYMQRFAPSQLGQSSLSATSDMAGLASGSGIGLAAGSGLASDAKAKTLKAAFTGSASGATIGQMGAQLEKRRKPFKKLFN